jgi:hypothetical protein
MGFNDGMGGYFYWTGEPPVLSVVQGAPDRAMKYYAAPEERQLAPRPDAAGRFGRIAASLGFDDPSFFGERHDAVLAVIKRASKMSAAELATLSAAQSAHMSFAGHRVVLSPEWKVAQGRLVAEARDAGRLALVGRAWETSSRLMRSLARDHGGTATRLASCALAGELFWALIDDVAPQRVMRAGDETVLRGAWQQMLSGAPAPPAPEPSARRLRSERLSSG